MGCNAAVNIPFEVRLYLFDQFSSIDNYFCFLGGNPVCCVNILPLTGCEGLTAAVEFFFRAD